MLNGNEKIIKHKVGMLNLAEELRSFSRACQIIRHDIQYVKKSRVGTFDHTRRIFKFL